MIAESASASATSDLQAERAQHAQEQADSAAVANSLREQLATLKKMLDDRDKSHEREVSNLKKALEELSVNTQVRERYSANGVKSLREDLAKASDDMSETQSMLQKKEGSLTRVLGELDGVYQDYASASRDCERARNQRDRAEHQRVMDLERGKETESALRWERHQRCAEIQQEKMEAVYNLREQLATAHSTLMDTRQDRIGTAAVLSVVCDESRDILRTRDALAEEALGLREESAKNSRRVQGLLSEKASLAERLIERSDRAARTEKELKTAAEEKERLREALRERGEFIDDLHFALQPQRF